MNELRDKVVLVTEGSRGAGREICRAFAARGARVAIIDEDGDAAAALADDLDPTGARVVGIRCDTADDADIVTAVRDAVDWFGDIDILVNNVSAGGNLGINPEDMTEADWVRCVVAGPALAFRFMQACHRHLVRGSRIVNVGGGSPLPAISDAMAQEWQWHGITVGTVTPFAGESNSPGADDLERLLSSATAPHRAGALVA